MNTRTAGVATPFSYDAHARTCAPDDFLGQTKRTVQGVPLGPDQVAMIVGQIRSLLAPGPGDHLLEVACGNGYLSQQLFGELGGYHGSDISEYLIEVARSHFQRTPGFTFETRGALETVAALDAPDRFTLMLCYASAQYFSDADLASLLRDVRRRLAGVRRFLVGNCPDRARAPQFFRGEPPAPGVLDDTSTALGRWRTREQFAGIAREAGWDVLFASMPEGFSGAAYRFDALLTPLAARPAR